MPKNTKGAPVRATTPARKAGGPSPKHRGYKPEAQGQGSPQKKTRWNADERAAKGRSTERPRGTQDKRGRRSPELGAPRQGCANHESRPARTYDRDSRPGSFERRPPGPFL